MNEMESSSPQAEQMAHESMVRNLAAQAEAIWPEEARIVLRAPAPRRILDVGCGTAEISERLLELFPDATLLGIDLEVRHLERARERSARFGSRAQFEKGDALHLALADDTFDLVVCRHLVQAVPDPARVVRELARVARPHGRVHVLAEDYGMMFAEPVPPGTDSFWRDVVPRYGAAIGCDVHVGRKMFTLMRAAGLVDIRADYVIVDTLRVPRDTFARIWEAWRDGYTDTLAEHSGTPREEVARLWQALIAAVRDERGYALWQVPIWTGQKP
jgi:ubiquinone/menaquinone biosynthesis C-methylase UbiE